MKFKVIEVKIGEDLSMYEAVAFFGVRSPETVADWADMLNRNNNQVYSLSWWRMPMGDPLFIGRTPQLKGATATHDGWCVVSVVESNEWGEIAP